MDFIGIKELSQNASKYINSSGWLVITKNGKPVKLMIDMDGEELEDFILSKNLNLEVLAESAKKEYMAGKTKSLQSYLKK